ILIQIEKLRDSLKEIARESKSLRQILANIRYQKKEELVRKVKGISVIIQRVEGLNNSELRELADSLKQKIGSGIVVLGSFSGERVFLITAVTKDLTKRIKANEFIKKIAPIIGGGGGGRSEFAQAGGTKPNNLNQALEKSYSILKNMVQ
ncbi:MAG: alanine--tRNA ligase, partial [Candidatus Aminicenantes bacterium]|nr:alanine--tRNA ligase [Candidatus Aminicenantes bacterium]